MPLDYREYGPDFRSIARRIIGERAGNRCEGCGVHNNAVGYWQRIQKGQPPRWVPHYGNAEADDYGYGIHSYGKALTYVRTHNVTRRGVSEDPILRVVKLACAHLDHDNTNHDEANLRALCQGCHRHHDSRDNAARRMYGETGQHHQQITLFNDTPYAVHPDRPRPARPQHPPKRRYRRRSAAGHRPADKPIS